MGLVTPAGTGRAVLIMGVVNVTPDSFSDGGEFATAAAAIAHGRKLVAQGADIVDVGGEATNPRVEPIGTETELTRVLPVVEALAARGAVVSIDTTKAEVARAAVAAGATIINDISAGQFDPEMGRAVAELNAERIAAGRSALTYIAGHLRGKSLAEVFAQEGSVGWRRVAAELADRLAQLPESVRENSWVDPGIGFGKGADPDGNLELLRHAGDIGKEVGRPVVVGPSRKRFLRKVLAEVRPKTTAGEPASEAGPEADPLMLDVASVAACLGAVRSGAFVVRAHNVALLRAALAVYTKI